MHLQSKDNNNWTGTAAKGKMELSDSVGTQVGSSGMMRGCKEVSGC